MSRTQWPRGLRHELSSLALTLGSWVRIPLEAWMSVCVYSEFVLGSGLATDWSLLQGVLPNVRLRNWSETKRFMDALCSKWEQQEQTNPTNRVMIINQLCHQKCLVQELAPYSQIKFVRNRAYLSFGSSFWFISGHLLTRHNCILLSEICFWDYLWIVNSLFSGIVCES
jgi:hypothetical protein